jgi:hypothetical protein
MNEYAPPKTKDENKDKFKGNFPTGFRITLEATQRNYTKEESGKCIISFNNQKVMRNEKIVQ